MKSAITILCVLLLAGCSSVQMKEPFPVSDLSEEERNQLEGTWNVDDEVLQVAFTSNGVAHVAWMEWKDEAFQLKSFPVYVTKQDETLYISLRIEDETADGYSFFELKPSDTKLIIWPPDVEFFKQLVENGTLEGKIEEDKYSDAVLLNALAVEILELISTNTAAFDYKEPAIFQRLE
ncbi:hypothetical protein P4C99_20360 [Pontiellaceae bacterium B1224]|nr:hypothetical protein [Pontiellaceae bacterium B1224]